MDSLGINSTKIRAVEIREVRFHNTLAMALAAKDWLKKNDPEIARVNICTVSIHGRKTWIAFKRALGNTCSVGILSFPQNKFPAPILENSNVKFQWLVRRLANVIYATFWPLSMVHYKMYLIP